MKKTGRFLICLLSLLLIGNAFSACGKKKNDFKRGTIVDITPEYDPFWQPLTSSARVGAILGICECF